MIKGVGVFIMQTDIETNKNENQSDDLIFVSGGVEKLDGSKSKPDHSENHIMIKMSDLEALGINYQSQCNVFKQTEKDGSFIADGDPCSITEKYPKVELDWLVVSLSTLVDLIEYCAEQSEIRKRNCFRMMCSCSENIYGLRLCFTKGNTEKKLDKNALPDDPDLVWLELKCDENGDKFLTKYNCQSKTWEHTDISFGLQDIYGGNDFDSMGENTVLEMYPKKTKFLTHFISCDSISIKEDESLSITNKIEADTGFKIDDVNVCACMQFKPNGPFYVDWNEKIAKGLVNGQVATMNDHNQKMEDVLTLRFYFADQKLNLECGDRFDNKLIENTKKSVFEIRRDKNGNMVLWHYDLEKKIWLPVNATVKWITAEEKESVKYNDRDCILDGYKDIHQYTCKVEKNTDESYSYTVNHSCTLDCHKPVFAEHFNLGETRDKYVEKLRSTSQMKGNKFDFYECGETNEPDRLLKRPKKTFSSKVEYESIKVDMAKQVDLFQEEEKSNLVNEVDKFDKLAMKIENTPTDMVSNPEKHLDSRKKKTIFYNLFCFLRKHKSKIVLSVIVGIVTAFLFSWFSIVSSIFLVALSGFSSLIVSFLLLLVLDKFIECPSVEDWFRYCKPPCNSELKLSKDSSYNSPDVLRSTDDICGYK